MYIIKYQHIDNIAQVILYDAIKHIN